MAQKLINLKRRWLPSPTKDSTPDAQLSTTPDYQITTDAQTTPESQLPEEKTKTLTPHQRKQQRKDKNARRRQNKRETKQLKSEQRQRTKNEENHSIGRKKQKERQQQTSQKDSGQKTKTKNQQHQDHEKYQHSNGHDKHSNWREKKKQNELRERTQTLHRDLNDGTNLHASEMITATTSETLVKIKPGAASENNNVDAYTKIASKQKKDLILGVAVDQNMAVSHNEVNTKMAGKLSLVPPSNNEPRQVGSSLEQPKQDIRSNVDLCDTLKSTTRWATQAPFTAKRGAIMWKTFKSPRRAIAKTLELSNSERTEHVCPDFPESLATLGSDDLVYGSRAVILSQRAHLTLQDRLWRTVIFANYFHGNARPEVGLPQDFHLISPRQQIFEVHLQDSKQMGVGRPSPSHRAAVEEAVLTFLTRTERRSPQELKAFTFANSSMASQLHKALREKQLIEPHELYEMFQSSYRKPAYDLGVDLTGIEALFDSEGVNGQ